MLYFRMRCSVEIGRQRAWVMWFRLAVFAVALVSLSLPAFARGGLSGAQKWKELLPTVRATTDCIAQGIVASPTALSHARQDNWLEAVKNMPEECKRLGSRLVTEHDRLFGPGTGKAFVEGRYASDLPRALKARIGPEIKWPAAQPAKADEAPAPAVAATETPVQVPLPALLPREPEEADSTRPRIEDLKAIPPVFPEEAAIKEQPAAGTAVRPVALRTPDVTVTQPRVLASICRCPRTAPTPWLTWLFLREPRCSPQAGPLEGGRASLRDDAG
jgi:hypothetical protein